MTEERIKGAFDSILLGEDAKAEIFSKIMAQATSEGLVDEPEQHEAPKFEVVSGTKRDRANNRRIKRLAGVFGAAACLVLAVGVFNGVEGGAGLHQDKNASSEFYEDSGASYEASDVNASAPLAVATFDGLELLVHDIATEVGSIAR